MKLRSSSTILFAGIWIRFFSITHNISLSSCSTVEELCKELIPDDYEIFKAPNYNGKSLNVFIGFQVLDIGEISEENMDYHLHMFIMYAWNDTRLKLEKYKALGRPAILYSECKNHIWTPDVFFEKAKMIETFQRTSPTTILNIFEDGSIVMSVRYAFKSNCAMEFRLFPFDTQRCHFRMALMYSHDSIATLKWLDDEECPIKDPPIQMMRKIDLLQFYFLEPAWSSFIKVGNDANYTSLVAKFTMLRRLTGCIISTFAPSVLIVIMSWVTFWLKVDAIPARVALSITSLLTLCTRAEQSKSQLPAVNYMTGMDIWLFMCIITVFSTLIVTALSYNFFSKKCNACDKFKKMDKTTTESNADIRNFKKNSPWVLNKDKILTFGYSGTRNSSPETNYLQGKRCVFCLSNEKFSQRIDDTSKIAFPVSFLLAAIFYNCYYLNSYYNNH